MIRSRAFASASLLAVIAVSCGSETDPSGPGGPGPRAPVLLTSGEYTVRVDPDKADVALLRGDTVLLDFPADGFELGALPAVDDVTNYDPVAILAPTALQSEPNGLEWLAVERVDVSTPAETAKETVTLALQYAKGKKATLTLEPAGPGSFKARLVPDPAGPQIAYYRLRARASDDEGFYGLGEYFDAVNHRGKLRAMQIRVDGELEGGYNEAHVPIPFVIGTRGWGLFVESAFPGVFNVAPGDNPTLEGAKPDDKDLVEAMFGTGMFSNDGLTFHLFGDAHPLDITKHYYDVTGYPLLPGRWALGPWVWRDESEDQSQVEDDLVTMRDLDLPASGYWIDRPYATAVNSFDFSAPQFPDPQAMIDKLHGLGFRTALWHTPYLDEEDPATAALVEEAESKGYYPPTTSITLNKWGRPIDLTNPDAYAFWQSNIEKYTSMGVEGFKLDYGEDVVPGLTGARNVWEFADGSDERTMHMRYQLFYHRVYAETLPEDGGFLLCRHGMYGDQTNVSVIWPGDLDATFQKHGEPLEGDTKLAVGGLPASIIAGLSLGPSGFPFYGADTGGYRHSPPDREVFVRWFEQTALSSVMQIGNSASTVAWELGSVPGYDQEMLDWYRTYTRLHLRLFPYEWTYAKNLAKDGRPIQRALGLAFPELGVHPNDTYLFGDHLLVAPVVERGATKRDVTLPKGRWIDWWDGKAYEGGQTITIEAPLGKLPLFLAQGAIVPMLRPTIDTLAPTTEPDLVDSYATTPGVLYARIAAGARSSFTLFDGAEIGQEQAGGKIALSSKAGAEFTGGVMFEVVAAGKKPKGVTDGGAALAEKATLEELDAAEAGWLFLPDTGGTVMVKTGPGAHQVELALP